jgi:hypothetical protein
MVNDLIKQKVRGRKVVSDEALFRGVTPVRLPNPNNDRQMERHFIREDNANWKIKCIGNEFEKCGQIRYLKAMNISEVNEIIQQWHRTHKKAVYNRESMGVQSYRGTIPNVESE